MGVIVMPHVNKNLFCLVTVFFFLLHQYLHNAIKQIPTVFFGGGLVFYQIFGAFLKREVG